MFLEKDELMRNTFNNVCSDLIVGDTKVLISANQCLLIYVFFLWLRFVLLLAS